MLNIFDRQCLQFLVISKSEDPASEKLKKVLVTQFRLYDREKTIKKY
jgi:hypothetical protein